MSNPESESPDKTAKRIPTGWTVIAKNDSVVAMVDTLLDMPAKREFHKSELAELADVSRKSVHTHIDLLLQLDLVTEVPDTTPQRYRFNPASEVARALMQLDGAVNSMGPHAAE